MEITHYVSIKFLNSSKAYYFGTNIPDLQADDFVVAESIRGMQVGKVSDKPIPIEKLSILTVKAKKTTEIIPVNNFICSSFLLITAITLLQISFNLLSISSGASIITYSPFAMLTCFLISSTTYL